MVEIEFNFNQIITKIKANLNEPFKNVIDKFLQKAYKERGTLCFLGNGKIINENESIESQMNTDDKNNKKMHILVEPLLNDDNNIKIIKSQDTICPECKESCRLKIENYKITLFECPNKHIINDIKFIDFNDTQKINESNIICNKCKIKNKGNTTEFYKCLTCKLNLCTLCRSNHDIKHNIIKYNEKNYMCEIHNEPLIKYCIECKKNICFACEEHEEHETIFLGNIKPNMEEKKEILNELKISINSIEKKIKDMINKLNRFIDFINSYYEINYNLYENYNIKKRNYQILNNINEINNNNNINKILKKINENNNIKEHLNDILDLYDNMNKENNKIKNLTNQTTSKKNNLVSQNNNKPNLNLFNEKYLKDNNNISNNQNNKMNKKENALIQEPKEIGLHTPENTKQINKNNSNNQNTNSNNSNKFICKNCKSPLDNINLILCQNCFKKEILDNAYSSYLESLNQKNYPEELIDANITIINFKNEKTIYNLDNALNVYNNIFKNEKLERKDIILELKKRICIACLNEIKSKNFIELPCKCRICSFVHLNEYLSYYENFNAGFKCRCKVTYTNPMMMELIILKGLNRNIQSRIKYFFQKKLDSCCCICKKSSNIVGQSNTIISLEKPYYNNFIHSLLHNVCKNCLEYQNTEFFCQICQIKHFWNSN